MTPTAEAGDAVGEALPAALLLLLAPSVVKITAARACSEKDGSQQGLLDVHTWHMHGNCTC